MDVTTSAQMKRAPFCGLRGFSGFGVAICSSRDPSAPGDGGRAEEAPRFRGGAGRDQAFTTARGGLSTRFVVLVIKVRPEIPKMFCHWFQSNKALTWSESMVAPWVLWVSFEAPARDGRELGAGVAELPGGGTERPADKGLGLGNASYFKCTWAICGGMGGLLAFP